MPTLKDDELTAAIAAGTIGAVTLDTSVFDKYGDNLRGKVLLSLKQFVGTAVAVVFSDIVVSEVKGHISRRATDTAAAVTRELKNHRQAWDRLENLAELGASAHLNDSPVGLAERLWDTYVDAVKATTLVAGDYVSVTDLTARYFSSSPPFSRTGKKKAEFPDAMALMSLEAWAKFRDTKVLVVSGDGDWKSFSDLSDHLVCITDVPIALDYFNREARFVASRTLAMLRQQDISGVDNDIANAVERFFDDNSMEIEAHAAPYEFEATLQGGALQYWTLKSGPLILSTTEEEIIFVVELDCTVSFEARIDWSVYADGDWRDIGPSTVVTAENNCLLQFTITCARTLDDEPEVYDVVVTSRPIKIDLGSIDPNWDYRVAGLRWREVLSTKYHRAAIDKRGCYAPGFQRFFSVAAEALAGTVSR
jgi:hypothetical protein